MKDGIKHIWFDLDGTLTIHTPEFHVAHDDLRYRTYAEVTKRSLDDNLKKEFEIHYKKHGSNSAVFRSFGLASDFWQHRFNTLDETRFFKPDKRVYATLKKLKDVVPISIFTNVKPDRNLRTLEAINVSPDWFTFILTGDDISERKPAPEGFYKIIEKSNLPVANLLYVGDRVDVDIVPAKKVGMKTCFVWGKSNEANYSFNNFEDLLTLIS